MTPTGKSTTEITDYDIVGVMYTHGGSFVTMLSDLWRLADDDNRARIKATWPEYWAEYRELVQLKRGAK
jgi:hypothetical protein